MTEREITKRILRVTARRLAIYRELQRLDPLDNRDPLCEELRECERRTEKLYAQLRWLRAGGWNPGREHKPSRTAVLASIRSQRRLRISDIRDRRKGAVA